LRISPFTWANPRTQQSQSTPQSQGASVLCYNANVEEEEPS
jgi:hypothetical protein